MPLKINICKMDDKGKENCTDVIVRKPIFLILIGLMIGAAVINFFIALGIGENPFAYIGLSLILSLIALVCLVPILGLVILIGLWEVMKSTLVAMFSLGANAWLDTLFLITWIIAIIAQVVALIWIIHKIILFATGKESLGKHGLGFLKTKN